MSRTCNRPQAIYEIKVQGELDPSWEDGFNGLAVRLEYAADHPPTTTLICPVADQAALRGIVSRLWDLNLTLMLVRRIEADVQDNGGMIWR